jgi:hypothetical protein
MTALAITADITTDIDVTTLEIERAERELASLLDRSRRLHHAHIEHDPRSCLVCFGA